MREPDPPGGGRGAGRGRRARGGPAPAASPIHSAEPGGRGARRPALSGAPASAQGPGPPGALPCGALPTSHNVRPCGQRAAGRDHFGLRRWVPAGPRASRKPFGAGPARDGARTGRRTPDGDAFPRETPGVDVLAPSSGGRGDHTPSLDPALALRAAARFPSFYCCLCLPSDDKPLEGWRVSSEPPGVAQSPLGSRLGPSLRASRRPPGRGGPAARWGSPPASASCPEGIPLSHVRFGPAEPTPGWGGPPSVLGPGRGGVQRGVSRGPLQAWGHPPPPPGAGLPQGGGRGSDLRAGGSAFRPPPSLRVKCGEAWGLLPPRAVGHPGPGPACALSCDLVTACGSASCVLGSK